MWFLAPGSDPWTRALVTGWIEAGLDVALHEVEPRALDAPQPAADLVGAFAAARSSVAAGFSRAARWLVQFDAALGARAMICVSFPFHRRDDPSHTHGLDALRRVTTPILIVQGTRDPHGTREQVTSYGALPSWVEVHWVDDGNHRLQPRARSGQDPQGQAREVTARVREFVAAHAGTP